MDRKKSCFWCHLWGPKRSETPRTPKTLRVVKLFLDDILKNAIRIVCVLFFLFAVVFFPDLDALEEMERHTQKAEALFELKSFEEAREIYEELLEAPLTPLQRAILQYDIGTTFLEEGRGEEAFRQFRMIDIGKNPSPLFVRRLKFNTALAMFQQAEALDSAWQREDLAFAVKAYEIILLLRQALIALEEVEQLDCQLARLTEGHKDCVSNESVESLNAAIKQKLASALEKDTASKWIGLFPEDESNPPLSILGRAFEEQLYALKGTLTAAFFQEINDALRDLLVDMQRASLKRQETFLQAVLELQKKQYQEERKSCQGDLWEEILSLYFQGVHAAKRAVEQLSLTLWVPAADQQKKVVELWGRALKRLREVETEPEKIEKEERFLQEESRLLLQEEEIEEEIYHVLDVLQRMDRDDRLPKAEPIFRGGEKYPW